MPHDPGIDWCLFCTNKDLLLHNFNLFIHVQFFVTSWTAGCQACHPSLSPWVCSNSCPLSQYRHPTNSSSSAPFSSCLQSFPASGSFPMSQLFSSSGQSIGASASALVFSRNIQDWFPPGLTGLISFQSKGHSRVFSQHHSSKASNLWWSASLWSTSHIHTWLLGKKT